MASGHSDSSVPSTPREALARTPWLSAVPDATLDMLAAQAVLHWVPAGSQVFEQADIPSFALLLIAGGIELLAVRNQQETLIEWVRAPDLLLPAAVLNRQAYLLRARVSDEAGIVMIHAEGFRRAVARDHALCLATLACQAAQFRRQVRHAKNIRQRSAEERVGCYLLGLANAAAGSGAVVRLPLERRLIASHLGMTRETLSRAFVSVARHGLRVRGDVVIVMDRDAASARFPLDPLIDDPELIEPLSRHGTAA